MPELSRFYGIIIYMFVKDHPPPHIHAKYGEYRAIIDIRTNEIESGHLPKRAFRLVQEWVNLHQNELLENWNEAQLDHPTINKIPPLE